MKYQFVFLFILLNFFKGFFVDFYQLDGVDMSSVQNTSVVVVYLGLNFLAQKIHENGGKINVTVTNGGMYFPGNKKNILTLRLLFIFFL